MEGGWPGIITVLPLLVSRGEHRRSCNKSPVEPGSPCGCPSSADECRWPAGGLRATLSWAREVAGAAGLLLQCGNGGEGKAGERSERLQHAIVESFRVHRHTDTIDCRLQTAGGLSSGAVAGLRGQDGPGHLVVYTITTYVQYYGSKLRGTFALVKKHNQHRTISIPYSVQYIVLRRVRWFGLQEPVLQSSVQTSRPPLLPRVCLSEPHSDRAFYLQVLPSSPSLRRNASIYLRNPCPNAGLA